MGDYQLDLDEVCEDYEYSSFERSHYIDLETGDVLLVVHHSGVGEQNEKNKKRIEEEDEGRYVKVPSADSREGYRDMQDFIMTVDDEGLKEKLRPAIDGKGAFHRFKAVLNEYPEVRERWSEFKKQRRKERVISWLERKGIDFIDKSS